MHVSSSVMSQFDKKSIDTVDLVKRYLSAEKASKSSYASVGFTLSNLYSASELSTGLSALKGADYELLKGLQVDYLNCVVTPAALREYGDGDYDGGTVKIKSSGLSVYRFTEGDILRLAGKLGTKESANSLAAGYHTGGKCWFIGNEWTLLMSNSTAYIEHTGNESAPEVIDNIYTSAVLIVSLKSSSSSASV
jgi:hypothetical protein